MKPKSRNSWKYHYKSLPNERTNFRLLKLLPSKGEDPIRCELSVEDFGSAPSYEAISYTWGKAADKISIICNGKHVVIPTNLRDALRQLRHENDSRILWADAICINQDDKKEHGHQVQIMGPILEKADRVLVWLGRGTGFDPGVALDLVRSLLPVFEALKNPVPGVEPPDIKAHIACVKQSQWKALRGVLFCEWFKRVWILQEIGLASEALVLCGEHSIKWTDLALFCEGVYQYFYEAINTYRLRVGLIINILYLNFKTGTKVDIRIIINVAIRSNCSEPRDRVYALLGHAAFKQYCASSRRSQFIVVDYSLPIPDFCYNVGKTLLELDNPLKLLSITFHTEDSIQASDFASWAPRWDIGFLGSPFLRSSYHASKNMDEKPSLDGRVLKVKGVFFDSVIFCSETLDYGEILGIHYNRTDAINQLKKLWEDLKDIHAESWSDVEEGVFERFCMTLNVRILQQGLNARNHMADCLAYFDKAGVALSSKTRFDRRYEDGDSFRFSHTIFWSYNRRLFITKNGHFGLGPGVTAVGDEVCILSGSEMPSMLRPQENGDYRFCGECYVDGIMDREVIDIWEQGELGEQKTFRLA